MISRLQTDGTSTSQRLWGKIKTTTSTSRGTCQSVLNRPHIMVKHSLNSTCKLIDMTIPSNRNIALKKIKKKRQTDNDLEIQKMWQKKKNNRSDPSGCWCAWYSKEGYSEKHLENIRESYCDRGPNDSHAGICASLRRCLVYEQNVLLE